jgi:UDP-glucose 4-epimerase
MKYAAARQPAGHSGERPAVLVTGGAGYVGRFVCQALARSGLDPIAYDDPSRAIPNIGSVGELQAGPLQREALIDLLRRTRPVAIVHLAGSRGGHRFHDAAAGGNHLGRNVGGTRSVLEAMAAAGPRRLVFASTSAIYGHPVRLPAGEDCPAAPTSDYGQSKLAAERLIQSWAAAEDGHAIILRFANVAGADAESGLGWLPGDGTIVPMAIRAAAGTIASLPVTASGADRQTAIRDFVHVSDVARATSQAVRRLIDRPTTAILNIASGRASAVIDVIGMVERVAGCHLRIEWRDSLSSEPPAFVADTARAATLLGFHADASDLATIVGTAWEWHRRHGRASEAAAPRQRPAIGERAG